MNFLYPQFLYGLLALSIPIIVHLFNFRRTRKVFFPNTRFLRKVKEASSSKLRLKHYLILLSRLLFIFFLVIAFAQPILKSGDSSVAQKDILIYFDNSYSMSNEVDEGMTAFDAGISYINELTELFPSATSYKLLTNDFEASGMIPKSKTELGDMSTELQYSSTSRSHEDIYNRIEIQKDDSKNIYWISDFQKSTSTTQVIDLDSNYLVNLIPLQFTATKNVAVDSIWLDNPFLIGNEKLTLNVKIRNYGLTEVSDLIVKVFVDDVQAATASINIEANTAEHTSFDLAFELNGINKCKIAFEEFPVTFDNEFFFTINGGKKLNVLEIKNTDRATSVTKVYGNEQLFNLTSQNIANLDYSLIEENDLVVINQLDEVDPSLASVINQYIGQYGHVLLIPSPTLDLGSYRQLQGFQSVSLKDSLIETELKTPDFNNPFFDNVFEEKNRNFAMPTAKKLLDWGRDRTALLSLKNGEPFLSNIGLRTNLYVLASPLTTDFTAFDSHALFVPVMYRLAVQSSSKENRLYYFIDEGGIAFKADTLVTDQVYKLKGENGEVIPSQRFNGRNIIMEVPKNTLDAGFYDLMLGSKMVTTLAFNRNFDESDLSQYTIEEIKSKFQGNATVFEASDRSEFAQQVENKYIGQPLWKHALILALVFLLAEVLLIRFFP